MELAVHLMCLLTELPSASVCEDTEGSREEDLQQVHVASVPTVRVTQSHIIIAGGATEHGQQEEEEALVGPHSARRRGVILDWHSSDPPLTV